MGLLSLPNETEPDNETLEMLENDYIAVILPVAYSIVALIGIPGNLFSLWILMFHTRPITSSIILMINLSITDLVLAAFLPFQVVYHIYRSDWIFGKPLCTLVTVLYYANMYSSLLTIMLISIERYLGVVHPMKSGMWRRKRYAIAAVIIIWILVMFILYPLLKTDLTYDVKHLKKRTCFDVLKWTMLPNLMAWAAFIISLFLFYFLLPLIVTVICYVLIILKLVQTSNRYGRGQERRSIHLALMVLLVFITCFAPSNFILLVHAINRLFFNKSYYHAYKLSLTTSSLSSCLDPFLYYFASKDFRKKAKEVWAKKVKQNETCETRRSSIFSALSGRSLTISSGHGEVFENGHTHRNCKRQESDV
ncbi:hypothetical protein XENTR_v10005194 [Xenopus tropicalis]|nr:P2Y purinoceptor 8 [Xenopus tropicalis]XP_012813050.1 P2Y purinoceptor 8 [Xenopus tropicalis]XP_031752557.1 P2Y purinoceptor 8 [Xenopus tropicalis]KAE8622324.1 hypothetical protein XENTR_v10005194 [Xenopus tropicalis]KAE8622325.1 hypothetical protein XENTR_v10005194 [Xenopus tropicalis]KAE8622326.1 hypothetical protein XENTR_v10005194 [Xenopus tropicalis]KAE8622327.1 hypothetical protein XENTR_v10005194 [Xenopus tropicalis]|eukprot:XP_012813049.1 PREDICTED: P2Y purinoceptor 8 [Xenopus tropicalis]